MTTHVTRTERNRALPRRVALQLPRAFTLIEMLVVLAIIGILSALVIAAVSQTGPKKMRAVTKTKGAELATIIELYKIDLGSYPPDNPGNPGTNTLFYELNGVLFTNNIITPALATFTSLLVPTNNLTSAQMLAVFGTRGIQNVARPGARPKTYFKHISEGRDYRPVTVAGNTVMLLTPPPQAQKDPAVTITWRYDASSNRRRNMSGFDLWADIVINGQTTRLGNW